MIKDLEKIIISDLILFDKIYPPKGFDKNQIFKKIWDLICCMPAAFAHEEIKSNFKQDKHVVIDESKGAVFIHETARIGPFTRLEGPLFIGKDTKIMTHSNISCSIINHNCNVGGEVHQSIFQPFSNKSHYGFVGHSFIGSWVNLGAGTTTSNMKNTYQDVKIKINEELVDTKQTFFGSIIGEHVKTAIGTNLNTGTVIGMGSNVVSQSFPPRYIPPFSFYYKEKIAKISFDDFCETAEKAMSRREKSLSLEEKNRLHNIYKIC